ncbi:sperm acrosome membrane-associated protein 4 [Salmo salar]|uniref:Sperm acrosome membrane-associated protein 4 n=2 Tax=Salmo TaxID=8028 RepID=A0A1S3PXM2_SALSA|nr:sperm acrosome membrane-associated protein 4-like [Salmo salar]|eukprot:XP_014032463.1 PREDICTED: sperm acrosome membrane-associated protein 4-like [Salmo salar]
MNKIIFGVLAVVASFMLAESLTCNKCDVGLVGVCLNAADQVCTTNTSRCFTGRATFPSLTTFLGFNTQGCLESAMCNNTTNATLLGATYTTVRTCCDTNKCNPVTISGATSAKLSVTAAFGAALVASVWGSMLY